MKPECLLRYQIIKHNNRREPNFHAPCTVMNISDDIVKLLLPATMVCEEELHHSFRVPTRYNFSPTFYGGKLKKKPKVYQLCGNLRHEPLR
jgi:hypothetical protein